jgi:glycosyltransferase involved in cell wall biosynthesis
MTARGPGDPRITVLMPVHNGEPYLDASVRSILGQTYGDFEFLVIDDGSTDGSARILRAYQDPRFRIVENGRNLGVVETLNRGLSLSRGEYVARMDCDDESLPERLERQVSFLDSHPEVGVLGTSGDLIDGDGRFLAGFRYPLHH